MNKHLILEACNRAHATFIPDKTYQFKLAQHILQIENMNAVEVLMPDGIGLVLYADWP